MKREEQIRQAALAYSFDTDGGHSGDLNAGRKVGRRTPCEVLAQGSGRRFAPESKEQRQGGVFSRSFSTS